MEKTNHAKEVGMVSAIIADTAMKPLYKKAQEFGQGYMHTADTISDWAIQFIKKHKNTNWEDVLHNSALKPLSKAFKSTIICWDDAIIDFAHYKLEGYQG
ncbi:MAG TPA: hypothetical protein VIJ57_10115 [Hanamia sp.]